MLDREREAIAASAPALADLTPARTGNCSVRREDRFAITPSGVPYDAIGPDDVPVVSVEGDRVIGDREPSSETPMHAGIYDRLAPGAIVHTHSPWATTLSILGESLPPVHYVLAAIGGAVPIAPYATYGTDALAANVVETMAEADCDACLIENHGLVATADTIDGAIEAAVHVESVARLYCQARTIGSPQRLSAEEMETVARKFETYGDEL